MSKKQAYDLAENLGARIEDDGWALQLIAPDNMVSGSYLAHTTCYPVENSRGPWEQIISDLQRYGFQECSDKNCGADHWENNKGGK